MTRSTQLCLQHPTQDTEHCPVHLQQLSLYFK